MWIFAINNDLTLDQAIEQFRKEEQALLALDKKVFYGVGLYAFLWAIGSTNLTLNVIAGCAFGMYYSQHHAERKKLSSAFQGKLDQLLHSYQSYTEKKNLSVTEDEKFLRALEALLPYVSSDKLLDFKQTNFDLSLLSDKFKALFAMPPHYCHRIVLLNNKLKVLQDNNKTVTATDIYKQLKSNMFSYFYSQQSGAAKDSSELVNTIEKRVISMKL